MDGGWLLRCRHLKKFPQVVRLFRTDKTGVSVALSDGGYRRVAHDEFTRDGYVSLILARHIKGWRENFTERIYPNRAIPYDHAVVFKMRSSVCYSAL